MRRGFVALLLAALALGVPGTPSFAFNQPPLNLVLRTSSTAPFPDRDLLHRIHPGVPGGQIQGP